MLQYFQGRRINERGESMLRGKEWSLMLRTLRSICLCWHTEGCLWVGEKSVHLAGGSLKREGSTGLGSEVVKGEAGFEFAAWNKPMLLKIYLETCSTQRTIMLTCISPASHKFPFLNFQNQRTGEVCLVWVDILLEPARNLGEAFPVVPAALDPSAQEPAGDVFITLWRALWWQKLPHGQHLLNGKGYIRQSEMECL